VGLASLIAIINGNGGYGLTIKILSLVFSVDALTLVFLIKEYDLNYSFNLIFIS